MSDEREAVWVVMEDAGGYDNVHTVYRTEAAATRAAWHLNHTRGWEDCDCQRFTVERHELLIVPVEEVK